jgi:two-component system chemotaxis sensor kinase CheA
LKQSQRYIFFFFILLLSVLQGGFLKYWYEKTIDDIGANAINISKVVANSIDIEKYKLIVETKNRDEYFYEMQEYFLKVQSETGIKYLYVEHKISETQIEYIFDAEKDSLGEIDTNTTPKAHLKKGSFHTKLEDSNIWGSLITGITPIIDKNDKIIGAVGVDVDKNFFMKELSNRIIVILIYCILTIALYSFLIGRLISENATRKKAQMDLQKSTKSLRDILNNTNQGFLTIGNDLKVNSNFSSVCLDIFGKDITGKFLPDLTFPNNKNDEVYMSQILKEFIVEKDTFKRDLYLPLIPSSFFINNRYINAEFKLIPNNKDNLILVILTDVTIEHTLQEQYDNEKAILKMVVNAVTLREEFQEFIRDYKDFIKEDFRNLVDSNNSIELTLSELFITVHTFKGLAGQLEMFNLVKNLHDLETRLIEWKKTADKPSRDEILVFIDNNIMLHWLELDLSLLKNYLGDKFIELDVNTSKLKDFNNLFNPYTKYISKLAQRLNKNINNVEIQGGNFPVTIGLYKEFAKSLIHIFRNSIDHGIESEYERIEAGKEKAGNITCIISKTNNFITINISDDGKGISVDQIKNKALDLGIDYSNLTTDEILNLVWLCNFSTKDTVSELSGRGYGLAAVKKALDNINGTVRISSEEGTGTEFEFILPLID